MSPSRRSSSSSSASATPPPAGPAAPADDPDRDTLNARAAMELAPWKKERAFFLDYDGWCDPRYARHLRGPKELLSDAAIGFFDVASPPPLAHPALLHCGFRLLTQLPLNRARKAAGGESYGVPVQVGGEVELLLAHHGLDAEKVVRGLADLQYAICDKHYPQGAKPERPSRALQLAFARFADGQLRIVHGATTQLNAEPDSAYFFVFAEFCIQGAHFAADPPKPKQPSKEWWRRLAALFARLNDVYCARYKQPAAERRYESYGATSYFAGSKSLTKAQLDKLIDEVEKEDPTLEAIVARVTKSAQAAFARNLG